MFTYLDNWEYTPAEIELNASFNLALGRSARKAKMYSSAMAPKKNGTAWRQNEHSIHSKSVIREMAWMYQISSA